MIPFTHCLQKPLLPSLGDESVQQIVHGHSKGNDHVNDGLVPLQLAHHERHQHQQSKRVQGPDHDGHVGPVVAVKVGQVQGVEKVQQSLLFNAKPVHAVNQELKNGPENGIPDSSINSRLVQVPGHRVKVEDFVLAS